MLGETVISKGPIGVRDIPAEASSKDIFLRQVKQYPRVTNEQMAILFGHLGMGHELGDVRNDPNFIDSIRPDEKRRFDAVFSDSKTIKDVLVICNLPLVIKLANAYSRDSNVPFLDLVQEGALGLRRAIDKYDPSREVRLGTYAYRWIKSFLGAYIDGLGLLPLHLAENIRTANRILTEFEVENGRSPTDEERKKLLGERFSDNRINGILNASSIDVVSLFTEVGENGEQTLEDFIQGPDDGRFEDVEAREIREAVRNWIDNTPLTQREKEVILLRYGFVTGRHMVQEQVAARFGFTRQRAKQLEKSAIHKLKKSSAAFGMNPMANLF